ncbi:MAG: hypothetical protein Q8P81_03410 [Nanoarchaeota archaeon]|nr:hypothetical protein [Nanoarchaeota archaeon]
MYKYIKESVIRLQESPMEKSFYDVPIIIKDPFLSNINYHNCFEELKKYIPYSLVKDLDSIYVGQFKHLNSKGLLASYDENVIYVNNIQPSDTELKLSIIHEFAHVAEDKFGIEIYGDRLLKKEFSKKRMWLYDFLRFHHKEIVDLPSIEKFMNIEYDRDFDGFLQNLGYDFLLMNTAGVFPSAYSITDIGEYWSVGWERIVSKMEGEAHSLKKYCPELFNRVMMVKELTEE